MARSYWRAKAQQVIEKVVFDNPDDRPDELLKKIDAAYPFGERANHPYQCWLKERKSAITRFNLFTPKK